MAVLLAIIVTSGLLAVFLPMTMTAQDAKPVSLVLTPSNMTLQHDFTFGGNESRALSFELSIPAGKQVNITFANKNGT